MRAPSTSALLVLSSLILDTPFCFADSHQDALKAKEKAKYLAACPAYEHYARFPQYALSYAVQDTTILQYTGQHVGEVLC